MMNVTVSEARQDFAEIVNSVAYGDERVVLERSGKKLAAIVPFEELLFLQELESRFDLAAARKALKEKGSISWKKLKAELGL